MSTINVIVNRNFDFEIRNNVIVIKQNSILISEFVIPQIYKISSIIEACNKNTNIILVTKKLNKPKFIPNNCQNLKLTKGGLYTIEDSKYRTLYYMDPTIYDTLYLDDFQNRYNIKDFEFPTPFWLSYGFRESSMNFPNSKLDLEFAINYAKKYDIVNKSRIITKKELKFLKYQQFYAGKCFDKYGLSAYEFDIDSYLKNGKELPFYLEFIELNFENWCYLVYDEKDNKYYLTFFSNCNYYAVDNNDLKRERIWSVPVIDEKSELVLK